MQESKQQKQTREFFNGFATQWSNSAKDDMDDYFNVIKVRGNYVLSSIKKYCKKNPRILDIACGTGDLVIDLLRLNYDAYGFDFAEFMIKKARSNAKKEKLPENRFFVNSFFDFEPKQKFDFISANGFIPYISEIQLKKFLKISHNWLNKKGVLVVESRNRLFNCISFNDYTMQEIKAGTIKNLLEECTMINNTKNKKSLLKEKFSSKLKSNLTKQGIIDGKHGKVLVEQMFQYTPFQLIKMLTKNKFKVIDIHPNHIHGVPTSIKSSNPKIHKFISELLLNQKDASEKLIPFSSSFSITAVKQ